MLKNQIFKLQILNSCLNYYMNKQISPENSMSRLSVSIKKNWNSSGSGRPNLQKNLMDEYHSVSKQSRKQSANQLDIMNDLFDVLSKNTFAQFINLTIFGMNMKIWRKGNIKSVVVFIDRNISNLLWISTQTKAFLFDLAYIEIIHIDLQFELNSSEKYYFILQYLDENIPFVFQNGEQMKKHLILFKSAIFHYQKLRLNYPPYLSKLIKYYTQAEQITHVGKIKTVSSTLAASEKLAGTNKVFYQNSMQTFIKQKYNITGDQYLNHILSDDDILQFFKIVFCCQHLKAIFQNYAQSPMTTLSSFIKPIMSMQHFKQFLLNEQKQTEVSANQIIQNIKSDLLSFYDFCSYLNNSSFNYLAYTPPINENLPLKDYFCYSSHNTYLSGNQITSESKVQRYIQDLSNGLKCVQIDIHNNGSQLIVTHAAKGLHLNKSILLQDVIKQINLYCYNYPNFYPIILSVQNNANKQSYFDIAKIILKHLEPFLLIIDDSKQHPNFLCKTLAELKGKIIIKADSKLKDLIKLSKEQVKISTNTISLELNPPQRLLTPNHIFNNMNDSFQRTIQSYKLRKCNFQAQYPKFLYQPVDQMTKITSLFKSPTGIDNQQSTGHQSTSLTNKKLQAIDLQKCVEYSKRSFLRIYPVATELSSGNYNPIPALQKGAQIIALNTQTKDYYAWLMMSYFTAGVSGPSESIGYIEKPIYLRTVLPQVKTKKQIEISVLSNFQNVKIIFFGSQRDKKTNQNKRYSFTVMDSDVAFLFFQINENLKDCIPLRFIREGYRVIIGRNSTYRDCGQRVLLRVKIQNFQIQ